MKQIRCRKTSKALKNVSIASGIMITLALSLAAAKAGETGENRDGAAPMPTEFPSVSLIRDSNPRFMAVRLDPWDKQVLYVKFDGNREQGYNRLYAWVPGSRGYNEPRALTANSDGVFPAVNWRAEEDDQVCEVEYVFRSSRSTGVHGGHSEHVSTHVDYETGRTITRTRSAAPSRPYTNISFAYTVLYTRDQTPLGSENLLRIRLPAPHLNPRGEFEAAPSRPIWEHIGYRWDVQRQTGADIDNGRLRITGIPHRHNHNVTFEVMPRGFFDIEISVAPYMRDPVFTQTIDMLELTRDGLIVDVPFTWYTASYRSETHPWIGGRTLSHSTGLISLGRTRPVQPGQEDRARHRQPSSTSRLRGLPPSQLRGPEEF